MVAARASWVRYTVVWMALLVLTLIPYGLSLSHLGSLDVVFALTIASVKVALVGLFFMHLAEERFAVVMTPLLAIFLLVLLISLMVVDVTTRRTFPSAPLHHVEGPD